MKKLHWIGLGLSFVCTHALDDTPWGRIEGQIRTFHMIEDNQEPLYDYYGTALGGKIIYKSPMYKRLQATVGVYTSHFLNDNMNTQSVEPLAGNKNSRYAIGLVDSTNYDENHITDLGEANLRYKNDTFSLTLGRMKLDTPFMNPQDGRMIPTLEQGAWSTLSFENGWNMQGGYIHSVWNRNTPDWKSIEDSLGFGYEMGQSALDTQSAGNYYLNTSSDGLLIGNVRYEPSKQFRLDLWDYYLENIFNLAYAESEFSHPLGETEISYALQGIYQQQSGDGGNDEDNTPSATNEQKSKSYMQEGEKSFTYGAKIALKHEKSKISLAYNQTTDKGRFLFPREWGKEPLFTFQKRERSEGSGNSHAWLTTLEHDFSPQGLSGFSMLLGYGEYVKTDPKEYRYNKYGLPSYAHWNIDLFYKFSGPLKGLKAEYLMTRKVARGETYQIQGANEYNFIFRKNGMTIHNIVLNYDF